MYIRGTTAPQSTNKIPVATAGSSYYAAIPIKPTNKSKFKRQFPSVNESSTNAPSVQRSIVPLQMSKMFDENLT